LADNACRLLFLAQFYPYGRGLGSCRGRVWDLGDVPGTTVVEESLWHANVRMARVEFCVGMGPGKRQGDHEGVETLDIEP
jgi:hypothetical protein